jgi:hypothetical protein
LTLGIFDLVFIACFLSAMIALLRAVFYACRRRWAISVRVLRRLGYGVVAYAIVLVTVSLTSHQTVLRMGETRCFDEWCISVERVARASEVGNPTAPVRARGIFYVVKVKVSNAARRRAQRAVDARLYLIDPTGHWYDSSPEAQRALDAMGVGGNDLTTRMPPGGSFERSVVFDLPREAGDLGLVVSHGNFPGVLIIGDSQSFLHPPTVVKLDRVDD